jgi:dihydrofolate reductase
MRKIVVTEFLSLDGVMEEPAWSLPYWNDAIAKFKKDELFASGAHLLGRVTYEGFAVAWPERKDQEGFADRMNSLPKYVVSTTLEKGDWQGTTIIRENIVEELSKLKGSSGGDFLVAGSATLVQTLLKNNLADEIHLLVYPTLVGEGKRLFRDGIGNHDLHLFEVKSMGSGVVLLLYGPNGKKGSGPADYSKFFTRA